MEMCSTCTILVKDVLFDIWNESTGCTVTQGISNGCYAGGHESEAVHVWIPYAGDYTDGAGLFL